MALIEIEGLSKLYPGGVRALEDVGFSVEPGEWLAVMGPSGSGKTTLVNLLGGLDTATSGRILFDGIELGGLTPAEYTRFRTEKVGFVFQQFHLVPYLTALENVLLAQYFHSMTDEAQARRALEGVGLGHRLGHLPAQLSTGEQQRVAIARALINQPRLILADEPTGNLDEENEAVVMQLFHKLHREGHTLVMVTHDPVIGRLADRRLELQHGRLAGITIYREERDELVDHLLQEVWMLREGNQSPEIAKLRRTAVLDVGGTLARMAERGLVRVENSHVLFTPVGEERARDVMRRYRLAERLFRDTFALGDSEAEDTACKFEHIISPEVTDRICRFLGHPGTCPHGNPIPPGACCSRAG
ncbi:MAG: ATP-binding cassette domain-containing protein [Acidobacteria bacterium]|nr:ATP-binding cassette domain-containing protein [Acidobacteriota bacterium]MCH7986595.1 ATP-binding cassette domain-containing protein [Acidobacteriota bacterium]MCH8946219.1 ATP-binding cassette domain-containing protein [Acidobacteriota bacterium]